MCEYCNPVKSHGNESIFKNSILDVYIVRSNLYFLPHIPKNAYQVKINFCPMCGRKLVEDGKG